MRPKKQKIFSELKESIGAKRDLNNATLAQYKTYAAGKKLFLEIFERSGRQWPRFWACIKTEFQKDRFPKAQVEDLEESLESLKGRCSSGGN